MEADGFETQLLGPRIYCQRVVLSVTCNKWNIGLLPWVRPCRQAPVTGDK